jgi:hypothetical protein
MERLDYFVSEKNRFLSGRVSLVQSAGLTEGRILHHSLNFSLVFWVFQVLHCVLHDIRILCSLLHHLESKPSAMGSIDRLKETGVRFF